MPNTREKAGIGLLLGSPALTVLTWGLGQMGIEIPAWLPPGAVILGLVGLAVSAILLSPTFDGWLKRLGILMDFSQVAMVGGALAILVGVAAQVFLAPTQKDNLKSQSAQASATIPVASAVLDFTLRGVGDLVRHDTSQNVEEAFAIYAAFEADDDKRYAHDAEALENPKLGREKAWYIAIIFTQPFDAREVRLKDVIPAQNVECNRNRTSQKFMLVRCKGLKIGTRAKLEITHETGRN